MLIVYRISDGKVLNGHNTNDAYPEGVAEVELANVISAYGPDDYGTLSLHDIDDADLVAQTLTLEYWVEDGQVVFGEPRQTEPMGPQPTPPPTTDELLQIILGQAEAIAALHERLGGSE